VRNVALDLCGGVGFDIHWQNILHTQCSISRSLGGVHDGCETHSHGLSN